MTRRRPKPRRSPEEMEAPSEQLGHWLGRSLEDVTKECDVVRGSRGPDDPRPLPVPLEIYTTILNHMADFPAHEDLPCTSLISYKLLPHDDCENCVIVRQKYYDRQRASGARYRAKRKEKRDG